MNSRPRKEEYLTEKCPDNNVGHFFCCQLQLSREGRSSLLINDLAVIRDV